jgi:signal transduction histidine kinase
MHGPTLVLRLAQHRTIGGAPPEEHAWLAAHGSLRRFDPGEVLAYKERPIEHLWIVLSGTFAILVDRGLGPRQVAEWHGGDAGGLLPYSRMTTPPGDIVMSERSEIVMIGRQHFPELIRECPVVTAALVHVMLDRARVFTSSDLHDEKMTSLGRLAAGLAHELNNPASAAARSAKLLTETLVAAEAASRSLSLSGLTADQLRAIDDMRQMCVGGVAPMLTPIDRSDRESALASWLEEHGADPAASASLVDTATTIEGLNALAAEIGSDQFDIAMRWIAACCTSRTLASDIERAASRIHQLVGAVKRFTYMDRQQAPEAVDVWQGVRDSVALLAHKARSKAVTVVLDVQGDIPQALAIGSDLNQVWTNLIDNALDAVRESGHVTVTATRERQFVCVHVTDDGPGIPAEIRQRVFDPFFTTKPVGQGTGLGLDIARRLVRRNGGDIVVESRPGHTEFRVTVPIAEIGA